MKFRLRTSKADAVRALSTAGSIREAAERLEVNRSTIQRWIRAGLVGRPGHVAPRSTARPLHIITPPTVPAPAVASEQTPEAWAAHIAATHSLDDTDRELLNVLVRVLRVEREAEHPSVRINAAGRIQALLRQLALPSKRIDAAAEAADTRRTPRPPRPDPRHLIMPGARVN